MARRREQTYRNTLSPGLVANGIIASLIIAGIGMTYAWLGWQRKERGDRNNALNNEIKQLQSSRQAQQVRMKGKLDGAQLRQRVEGMALGLVDIPAGKVITVPDAPKGGHEGP